MAAGDATAMYINRLVGLEFKVPVNTVKIMLSWSFSLTIHFLGRLSPVLVHICLKLSTALLESAEGRENDHRKYFKINLHERM